MDKLDKFGHFHWRGIFETCAQTKIGENYELSIFENFKFKNLNRIYIEAESLSLRVSLIATLFTTLFATLESIPESIGGN